MLRLLHISDIHFRTPFCESPQLDRDGPIRDQLIKDLAKIVGEDDQNISAILVTGDIAYQANPKEFEVAAAWLDELCSRFSIPPQNVYVVPGNHDVNRIAAKKWMVNAVRQSILGKQGEAREMDFRRALEDSEASLQLLKPLEEYNQFAARYGCDISAKRPVWMDKLQIDPGIDLIINGLTSTFFSGPEDAIGQLFLGSIQTNFRAEDGCIHLSMMHHPCDWFENSDDVAVELDNGAAIQLIGHKHRSRWDPSMGTIRIHADSIHPDRSEGGYEPGYNILDLSRTTSHLGQHQVTISARIRVLQRDPRVFRGKINSDQSEVFVHHIPINPSLSRPSSPEPQARVDLKEHDKALGSAISEDTCGDDNQSYQIKGKETVFRFWDLHQSYRAQIINDLGLLEHEDTALPEYQQYRIAFQNARIMGKVEELLEKITEVENLNG